MTPTIKLTDLSDWQLWQVLHRSEEPEGEVLAQRALKALRRAQKIAQRDRLSLAYSDAVALVGREMLDTLHCLGAVRVCKEAPPYVVYVY